MILSILAVLFRVFESHVSFPRGAVANEEIVLRWMHLVSGIIWIGLLYFFNLVGFATMKQLDAPVRAKVYPVLMSRAMWWFRWSALVTVIAGLRYFFIILSADAHNAGDPALALRWFGEWLAVWLVAYAIIFPLQMPSTGLLDRAWVRAPAIALAVIAAAKVVLDLNSGADSSNSHLSISVGGGLGLLMLLNAWGVVWRAQKKADCVDADERRTGHADAGGSRAAGAVVISCVAHGILAVISDAFLDGRCGALSISQRDC